MRESSAFRKVEHSRLPGHVISLSPGWVLFHQKPQQRLSLGLSELPLPGTHARNSLVSQKEKHFNLPSAYQAAKRERVSEHQVRKVSTDCLCRPLLCADPPTALYGGDRPGHPRHASQSPGSQSRTSLGGGAMRGCWQLLRAYCAPVTLEI